MRALRILVVEDDGALQGLIADLLQELGHAPTIVEDGEAALARFEADPGAFDLAIVDLGLPGMDGLETVRALRRAAPGLRGILSSGLGATDERGEAAHMPEARRLGLVTLDKPYRIDALEEALAWAASGPSA